MKKEEQKVNLQKTPQSVLFLEKSIFARVLISRKMFYA